MNPPPASRAGGSVYFFGSKAGGAPALTRVDSSERFVLALVIGGRGVTATDLGDRATGSSGLVRLLRGRPQVMLLRGGRAIGVLGPLLPVVRFPEAPPRATLRGFRGRLLRGFVRLFFHLTALVLHTLRPEEQVQS